MYIMVYILLTAANEVTNVFKSSYITELIPGSHL